LLGVVAGSSKLPTRQTAIDPRRARVREQVIGDDLLPPAIADLDQPVGRPDAAADQEVVLHAVGVVELAPVPDVEARLRSARRRAVVKHDRVPRCGGAGSPSNSVAIVRAFAAATSAGVIFAAAAAGAEISSATAIAVLTSCVASTNRRRASNRKDSSK
jgi:hypothetical protein